MKPRFTSITGVILILLGLAILIHQYYGLDWYFVRSYGFFVIGLLGILRGLSLTPRRKIYSFAFLMFVGLYFMLGEWGIIRIEQGLTISAFTMFIGTSFFVVYLVARRKWEYLLFGSIFLTIGVLFLLEYLRMLPPDLLVTLVDVYWPVLLIIIGLAFLLHDLQKRKHREISTHSPD